MEREPLGRQRIELRRQLDRVARREVDLRLRQLHAEVQAPGAVGAQDRQGILDREDRVRAVRDVPRVADGLAPLLGIVGDTLRRVVEQRRPLLHDVLDDEVDPFFVQSAIQVGAIGQRQGEPPAPGNAAIGCCSAASAEYAPLTPSGQVCTDCGAGRAADAGHDFSLDLYKSHLLDAARARVRRPRRPGPAADPRAPRRRRAGRRGRSRTSSRPSSGSPSRRSRSISRSCATAGSRRSARRRPAAVCRRRRAAPRARRRGSTSSAASGSSASTRSPPSSPAASASGASQPPPRDAPKEDRIDGRHRP